MLTTRSLRLAAVRYVRPFQRVTTSRIRNLPILLPSTAIISMRHSLAAAYSKEAETAVFISSPFSFGSCNKKNYFTSSVNLTTNLAPTPLKETPLNSNNPSSTSAPPSNNISGPSLSSDNPIMNSSSPPSLKETQEAKNQTTEISAGTFDEAGIKLPSRDQVEGFVFKVLVYLWDFTYFIFCLCRKLFQKYVMSNSTVQENLKTMQKRMEDARKEIKSK